MVHLNVMKTTPLHLFQVVFLVASRLFHVVSFFWNIPLVLLPLLNSANFVNSLTANISNQTYLESNSSNQGQIIRMTAYDPRIERRPSGQCR